MTDIPQSTASPARVAVGGTYNGSFETAYDRDAVGFEGRAGVTYRVTLDRGQLDNYTLGDLQAEVVFRDPNVIHVTPRTDGTVFLPIEGRNGSQSVTGAYTLGVAEVTGDVSPWPEGATLLSLGDTLRSALDFNGDSDRFDVMLEAGQGYRISVLGENPELADRDLTPYAILVGSDGRALRDAERLFGDPRGDTFITYTPTVSGPVGLVVGESYNIPTGYEIRVETFNDLPPGVTTPASLAVGGSVAGTFEYRVDEDAYAVELEAGPTYAFSLAGAGNQIRLQNAAGEFVNAAYGATPTVETSVAVSGTFYLSVKAGEFFNGDYTVSAEILNEIPGSPATEAVLEVGVPIQDSLFRGDSDWFGIDLDPDTTYRVSYGQLSGYDVRLSVHDASGASLLEETRSLREQFDRSPRSLVFSSAAVPDAAFLGIRSERGNHDYTLRLEAVGDIGQTDAGAGTLAVGQTLRSHLFQGDVDRFALDLPDTLVGPNAAGGPDGYLVTVAGVGFGPRPVLSVDSDFAGAPMQGVFGDTAYAITPVAPLPGGEIFVDVSERTGPFGQPGAPFYHLRADPVTLGTAGDDRLAVADGLGLLGLEGRDTLTGSEAGDILWGGADGDVIFGLQGDDTLRGEAGDDTLHAGAGDDLAQGGGGHDLIIGHGGNDDLAGNGGSDTLIGGAGDDTLNGGFGADALTGGAGADTFYLSRDNGPRDWIADYDRAQGDMIMLDPLIFDPNISRGVFLQRRAIDGVGDAGVDEVVVVALGRFSAGTQDIAVLVDGADQDMIRFLSPGWDAYNLTVPDLLT